MTKGLLYSRTFWFNVVSFVVLVIALPEFVAVVPERWIPYVALINAIGNVFLRASTEKKITGWF